MWRLRASVLVLAGALLGFAVGLVASVELFPREVESSADESGRFVTENLGRDYLWMPVATAIVFAALAVMLARRFVKPS